MTPEIRNADIYEFPQPTNEPKTLEGIMKQRSREIIVNDYVGSLPTKPSEEQINRATSILNAFRMTIFTGGPVNIDRAISVETNIKSILKPKEIDSSRSANPPKKVA